MTRRILFSTIGTTPQVVTETVWALNERNPPWRPDEVHIVTTTHALGRIRDALQLPSGHLSPMFAGAKAPAVFIHVPCKGGPLARRFDVFTMSRWSANHEFEELVLAILRNLPLRHPSTLTATGLRRILQITGGVTARIFRLLNELAIEAIETGAERITDEAVEHWKSAVEEEAVFA